MSAATLEKELGEIRGKCHAILSNAKDGVLTTEEQSQFQQLFESGLEKRKRAEEMASNLKMLEDLSFTLGEADQALVTDLETKSGKPRQAQQKSMGDLFTEHQFYKAWQGQLGGENGTGKIPASQPVPMDGAKASILSTNDTGPVSSLVREDWQGLVDMGTFMRPLTFNSLINEVPTDREKITYARLTGFTNNAAFVTPAAGVLPYVAGAGQVSGVKPQSDMILDEAEAYTKTLAHWMAATRQALANVSQLRDLIDTYLRYGLDEVEENEMVAGPGGANHFEGVLNMSGTQSQPWDTNLLVTARKAITKVQVQGRGTPTAFVFNPADNERFDLLTDANGQFYFGGPAQVGLNKVLWGVPRVQCEAVPAGTGLLSDWRWYRKFRRHATTIRISDQHEDFFTRNMAAVLAENEKAFLCYAPIKTVEIDLTA